MYVHGFPRKVFRQEKLQSSQKKSTALSLVPNWTDCMSHEFESCKEAFSLCREEGTGIQAALWTTVDNTEHRMIHWLQLISIANSRLGGSDCASLERKVNDLQREVRREVSVSTTTRAKRKAQLPTRTVPASGFGRRSTTETCFNGRDRAKNNAPQKGKNKGTHQGGSSSSRPKSIFSFALSTHGQSCMLDVSW